MENKDKIILDLCGGTGAWSDPYKQAGYDVRNITLPEFDVRIYIPPDNVYGILAAPDCTEFSLAKNGWAHHPTRGKRDFVKGMEEVNACLRIIFQCSPIFWVLENPVGLLSRWLGKTKYTFHPWFFGEPWSKFTALWGNFNPPQRKYYNFDDLPSKIPIINGKIYTYIRKGTHIPSISEFTSGNEKAIRAITPSGFAQAFFEVNQ